ncbi:CIC11C00000000058 [Sungouiella intermedia]|uniref:CIC11C00000000058 n=1 Tax=Sungouiella intermedia TaxID=45354 RepID=A0A1L0DT48_9ASCO|nr:CIC11C00000000058 [[Candida] intermedia]
MARQFPLVRTYQNLVWNLKNYKPAGQRPPFRASRHPFCTNIQLQNASCAYWLQETSREIGTEFVTLLANSTKAYKKQVSKNSSQVTKLHSNAEYQNYSSLAAVSDGVGAECNGEGTNGPDSETIEVHPAEIEIVKLFGAGEYSKMYQILKAYQAEGITISTDIINGMVSSVHEQLPIDTSDEYLHQSAVEVPMFHGKNDLRYMSMYGRVYSHIETLYEVCKLYEPHSLGNRTFVENYIWLCYHMDDLASLQHLLYTYLKNSTYDSRTLSYVINAFVYNYDVEFAKNLIKSIIDMGKPLDESLLSSTIISFVKVGAIFTNITDLVEIWSNASNCESPYPKTVAMLLKQYYRYGNPEEIASMEALREHLGYNSNFLISLVKNQERISRKDLLHKKNITKGDIEEILKIRNSISHSKYALKAFYESYLLFFSKYSSMNMIQLMLREMKKDGLPFTKFSYNVIVQHYVSEHKFLPLLKFMEKFVTKANRFEMIYVKSLYEAFVRTYPYEGEYFAHLFSNWLENAELPSHTKEVLQESCKVTKLKSNITPVAIQRQQLNNVKKYLSPQWRSMALESKSLKSIKEQVQFRVDKGLLDIMRKGIKPDYHLVENTLRKLNLTHRSAIFDCLKEMRMERYSTRLRIFDFLLSFPKKDQLVRYVKNRQTKFNASDRLLLARRLFNENSFDLAFDLLKNMNEAEVNDNRQMIRLNLSLRTGIAMNDFESCNQNIEAFPINELTMSPYIYKQCQYIEKNLVKKMKALEAKGGDAANMKVTLDKLKGLIGDIDARLKRDKLDIHEMVGDMFNMLNKWIKSTRNQDERKV